jgi:endonuclease YncB( thermonuclease family)
MTSTSAPRALREGGPSPRVGALVSALAVVAILSHAASLSAQEYHWTDARGQKRVGKRFEDCPASRRESLVCRVAIKKVLDGEHLLVEGGHRIRLAGVDAPDLLSVEGAPAAAAARKKLSELIGDGAVELRFDQRLKDARFATFAWVRNAQGLDLNRELVRSGTAYAMTAPGIARYAEGLLAAQAEARRKKRGLWAAKLPKPKFDAKAPFRGFSLGLYASTDDFDYLPFLREMKEIGCVDVLLITPWFIPDHLEASFRPKTGRSIPMTRLLKVMQQAHSLGLRPSLMPIILLEESGENYWRGNIKPKDPRAWMIAYEEMLLRFADCARRGACDLFLIGSELSSMERYESSWRGIVKSVRQRFDGRLSYSANWDHLTTIRWWDALDLIGTTGYHELTKSKSPAVDELTASWTRIREELRLVLEPLGKPWFFTELGYASLDGIAANPWDYVSPEKTDPGEQADCYEAWIRAWATARKPFHGAFFYTWWRNGDASDAREYSVHGKPAEAVIRRYLKQR